MVETTKNVELDFLTNIGSGITKKRTVDREAALLKEDVATWLEKNIWIKTKDTRLVPFKLNRAQKKFVVYVQECLDKKRPIRAIILKARQLGFSTLIEALLFAFTITNPNTSSKVIAHDIDSSSNLFGMTELYYEKLNPEIKPMKRRQNRQELIFANPNEKESAINPGLRSKIEVDTANNIKAGRSWTGQWLHISEIAFWSNPGELLTGLVQAVPDTNPLTGIFLESTANGIGDYFNIEWEMAQRGESIYTPFFFPWFEEPEYRLFFVDKSEEEAFSLTQEELDLRETVLREYNVLLDNEQLRWRRNKRRQLEAAARADKDPAKIGLSGTQLFQQEYPSTPREAFISTGRPVFNIESLQWYEKHQVRPPEIIGNLYEDRSGQIKVERNERGYLKIWENPTKTEGYIIGVDIAEGLGAGDYSCMPVISQKGFRLVAEWWGHIDPDLLTNEAEMLGIFYNKAFIVPEANNQGILVCRGLQKARYPHIYMRQTQGLRYEKEGESIGWLTTPSSKRVMVEELAGEIRDKTIGIPSVDMIDELYRFVRDDKGRTRAQLGSHDDRVMALALAVQGINKAPKRWGRKLAATRATRVKRTARRGSNTSSSFTGYE